MGMHIIVQQEEFGADVDQPSFNFFLIVYLNYIHDLMVLFLTYLRIYDLMFRS
jgi:hypothetical protein